MTLLEALSTHLKRVISFGFLILIMMAMWACNLSAVFEETSPPPTPTDSVEARDLPTTTPQPTATEEPPPLVANPTSFEDLMTEAGYGWLSGYWAAPAVAVSSDPADCGIGGIADYYGLEEDTGYDLLWAYMEMRDIADVDDWMLRWETAGPDGLATALGHDLTYMTEDDHIMFAHYVEQMGSTPLEWLEAQGYESVKELLEAEHIEHLAVLIAQWDEEFGFPLVFVSERVDPSGVNCVEAGPCMTDLFLVYPFKEGAVPVGLGLQDYGLSKVTTPRLSPDGTMIAFAGKEDASDPYDLYTYDLLNHGMYQLTDDDAVNWQPYWSPDGTRIAYRSGGAITGEGSIYVIDVESKATTRVTGAGGQDSWPTWQPDSEIITFKSDRIDAEPVTCGNSCDYALYSVAASGGTPESFALTFGQTGMAWSTTDRVGAIESLSLEGDGHVVIYVLIEGVTDVDNLAPFISYDDRDALYPSFSPDGQWLVYFTRPEDQVDKNIVITPVDRFEPIVITTYGGGDFYPDW